MKPLVYPFKTAMGCYFYETQRNEIVSVGEELYDYIEANAREDEGRMARASDEARRQYEELAQLGYLAPPHVEKIRHGASYTLAQVLNRRLDRVVLQVTQSCNLRCAYCVYSENTNLSTRSHANKWMDLATAKQAVDFLFAHSLDNEMPAVGFYGGEPLLAFDLIKETVAYAKQVFAGRKLIFSITTNATLMSDEVIDFLIANQFSITVSMDGPKRIQDKNRKFAGGNGSYDVLIANLAKLKARSKGKPVPFTLNMVIDSNDDYEEIVSLFDLPLLRDVKINYTFIEEDGIIRPVVNQDYLQAEYYNTFLGLVGYFRDRQRNYPNKLVEYDMSILHSTLERTSPIYLYGESAPGGPCVPGKMRLFVDYKGSLFPCERVSETSPCMEIGTLRDGFDLEKIDRLLNVAQLTEDACKSCWAFSLCSACAKHADTGKGLCGKKKLEVCQSMQNNAYGTISSIALAHEHQKHERRMRDIRGCEK